MAFESEEKSFLASLYDDRDKMIAGLKWAMSEFHSIHSDWDCDSDAHKYGTPCRCCEAEAAEKRLAAILEEVQ